MNPGLVVKLRPAGPWRIGPDSGARNRVDVIYHSDSLYSAVTSAMSRMGSLDAWLDATARSQSPAVCFSSCFPFLDDVAFVVPPRTIWPPTSPAAMSARVRWKSARFIPLTVVESILSGRKLNDNQWSVDGASGCLVPAGKPGPFRTSVRWNAAVDRLSGASERHATACIEFREGCGLWTVVGFHDEAARDQWQESVKAAFRLLADSGFGGERSRGWGRAETPQFVEGTLPGLIIEYKQRVPAAPMEEPATEEPPVEEPVLEEVPATEPPLEEDTAASESVPAPIEEPVAEEPPIAEPARDEEPALVPPVEGQPESSEAAAPLVGQAVSPASADAGPTPEAEAVAPEVEAAVPPAETETPAPAVEAAAPEVEGAAPLVEAEIPEAVAEAAVPEAAPEVEAAAPPAEAEIAEPVAEAAVPGATPAGEAAAPLVEAEIAEPVAEAAVPEAAPEVDPALPPAETEIPEPVAEAAAPDATPETEAAPPAEAEIPEPVAEAAAPEAASELEAAEPPAESEAPAQEPEPALSDAQIAAVLRAPDLTQSMRVAPERELPPAVPTVPLQAHWLLSLFTPAAADAVDWGRGSYTVLARGGRIDSPSVGSGELKKQIQMVAEGSVLYADGVPLGAAADVAPDGFAHPVFRAGFALSIPLPEVH